MAHLSWTDIIKSKPIGRGLNAFCDAFDSTCADLGLSGSPNALRQIGHEDLQDLALNLVFSLQVLPAASLLRSQKSTGVLRDDLVRFAPSIVAGTYNIERALTLCERVIDHAADIDIWDAVDNLVTESTPPPQLIPYLGQTPFLHNTSSFVNSSKHRKYVDDVLKEELGSLFVGVPDFYRTFFGHIERLEEAAVAVFQQCKEGETPIYSDEVGWHNWPENATQNEVLTWLTSQVNLIRNAAEEQSFFISPNRRIWARPDQPLQGSTAEQKLDIGFITGQDSNPSEQHWSHILIPGELKSNPGADTISKTWLDLGRYVREVFAAQHNRRFVLGFTLCGSTMRLWEFDRAGGVSSPPFDINKDGQQFVSVLLAYLWMSDTQLGFDPTIMSSDGVRFIEIVREGNSERLIIDNLMKCAPCIAGRATTCWKAHREGDKSPLVIKDSWQYPEREEEGLLLREATEKGVVNVAGYYHHETVRVDGKVDDVHNNVRKGLDIKKATNFKHSSFDTSRQINDNSDTARKGRPTDIRSAGRKRSSSHTDVPQPPGKRTCSSSPTKDGRDRGVQTRVHRRVIIRDYGKPIYRASSRADMLAALESCIEGYESLRKNAGMLQGDISIGNLLMREEDSDASWPAFLIDLDLAIKEQREQSSGARGKTGTRAFMAIGLLMGEKHSFMHDLESFFWVLFWICVHYNGPNERARVVPEFDTWNYVAMEELAKTKKGTVGHEGDFLKTVDENFTGYYRSLGPWVNRLRKVVFPNGGRWEREDRRLYSRMKDILRTAGEDPEVLAI